MGFKSSVQGIDLQTQIVCQAVASGSFSSQAFLIQKFSLVASEGAQLGGVLERVPVHFLVREHLCLSHRHSVHIHTHTHTHTGLFQLPHTKMPGVNIFAVCLIRHQGGVPFVVIWMQKTRVQFFTWLLLASGKREFPQGPRASVQDGR